MEKKNCFTCLKGKVQRSVSHYVGKIKSKYSLWGKLASGKLGVSRALRDKRRSTWQQTTRDLVKRVFEQAEEDFKETIQLNVWDPESRKLSGTLITNMDSFALSPHSEKTGITYTQYHLLEVVTAAPLLERRGDVQVCQDHNGLIHIYFYPIELDTEDASMPPRQRLLYGRYEPWDLTEAKLKKAVARGVRLLLESRTGCRRSLYSWWLYIKNSQFYMGIIWGVVLAIPGGWIGNGIVALAGSM